MSSARGSRRLRIAILALALLGACRSSETSPSRFGPVTTEVTVQTSTTPVPRAAPPQWTARSFRTETAAGGSVCIELTTPTTTATTCLGLPGVSSWTVADAQFLVAAGDIALTDGTVIRADATGVAIGILPPDAAPMSDAKDACTRHALAPAIAGHYPGSTVSWVPGRCAGGAASVSALLADRSEVIALMAQANDGHWEVFATFRAPVRCALLDVMSRNMCKLLQYDD